MAEGERRQTFVCFASSGMQPHVLLGSAVSRIASGHLVLGTRWG